MLAIFCNDFDTLHPFEMTDGKLIPEFLSAKVEVSHLTPSNIYELYTTIIGAQGPSNNNTVFNEFMDEIAVLDTNNLLRIMNEFILIKSEKVQIKIVS